MKHLDEATVADETEKLAGEEGKDIDGALALMGRWWGWVFRLIKKLGLTKKIGIFLSKKFIINL